MEKSSSLRFITSCQSSTSLAKKWTNLGQGTTEASPPRFSDTNEFIQWGNVLEMGGGGKRVYGMRIFQAQRTPRFSLKSNLVIL